MSSDSVYLGWQAALGPALTSFVLSLESEPSEDLSRAQRAALTRLDAAKEELRAADSRLAVALVRVRDGELGLGWALRRSSGGHLPEPIGETAAERLLSQIARDCYPALLSVQDAPFAFAAWGTLAAPPSWIGLAHVVDSHVLLPVIRGVLAEQIERSRDLLLASAMGVTPVVEALDVESLLSAARRRLRHDVRPGAESFMGHAVDCLRELVLASERTPPPVRALIGLSGMPTDSAEQDLPQGILRRVTPGEAQYAPVGFRADAVLETHVDAVVTVRGEDASAAQISGQQRLTDVGRELCLAAVLAYEPRPPISAPAIAWSAELAPGPADGAFRPSHPHKHQGMATPDQQGTYADLAQWAQRVAEADLQHIGIAVDRILRSLWEVEWSDSLIDAVIAWENLVGTSVETSFRVTAAMTVLCQIEPSARLAHRKRLSRVYDDRSRLVHGETPRADVADARAVATATALDALGQLMVRRPDLLALAKSSERADRLLLTL